MIRLQFPAAVLTGFAEAARRDITAQLPQLVEAIADDLVKRARVSFRARASGRESLGITWAPLDPEYLDERLADGLGDLIGIVSGDLLQSAAAEISGNRITIEFRDRIARAFDRRRQLLPDETPPEWIEAAERMAADWLAEILNTETESIA